MTHTTAILRLRRKIKQQATALRLMAINIAQIKAALAAKEEK